MTVAEHLLRRYLAHLRQRADLAAILHDDDSAIDVMAAEADTILAIHMVRAGLW